MTKKEKLEKLLQEIPCLLEDYQKGEINRYSPFGKYKLSPEELNNALSIVGNNKLLCVIEQDMLFEGKDISLINYVIDETGFTPQKQEQINPAIFSSEENYIDLNAHKQISYIFQAFCFNKTWNQYDHGMIGIIPFENTILRIW